MNDMHLSEEGHCARHFVSPGVGKTVAALDAAIADKLAEIRPGVRLTGIAIIAAKTIAETATWPNQEIDDILQIFIDRVVDTVMQMQRN